MNEARAVNQRLQNAVGTKRPTYQRGMMVGPTMRCHRLKELSIEFRQNAHVGIAQAMRLFQDHLEDRCRITLRLVDHSQNFSQRRLPGQRRIALGTIFLELLLQCRIDAL